MEGKRGGGGKMEKCSGGVKWENEITQFTEC